MGIIGVMKMIENTAALTIAGSDSGGGAGIQADIKTFSAFGVFGTSVITAVTAQNLEGVTAIQPVKVEVVRKQMLAVLEGFPIKAIKTGMLYSADIIETVAALLAGRAAIPLVIDPVFAATSGKKLIREDAVESLKGRLFPLGNLLTPNMPEAEILLGREIRSLEDLERAAENIFKHFGVPVLLKGGHLKDRAFDVLADGEGVEIFPSVLIDGVNNHGSGCTLAAGIAAALAGGQPLRDAVFAAKEYITNSLKYPYRLSADTRVINHSWDHRE